MCTQIGADGAARTVPGATLNLAARQVGAHQRPAAAQRRPPASPARSRTRTPRGPRSHSSSRCSQRDRGAVAVDAHGDGPAAPPPAVEISGPSGSTAVTTQRVPAGTYDLSEAGTGAAATGYVQAGAWSADGGRGRRAGDGRPVTLADSAAARPRRRHVHGDEPPRRRGRCASSRSSTRRPAPTPAARRRRSPGRTTAAPAPPARSARSRRGRR